MANQRDAKELEMLNEMSILRKQIMHMENAHYRLELEVFGGKEARIKQLKAEIINAIKKSDGNTEFEYIIGDVTRLADVYTRMVWNGESYE